VVSAIDQRLAGRFHQWQVDTIDRSERLAGQVGRIWNGLVKDLVGLASEDRPYHDTLHRAESAFAKTASAVRDWVGQWAERQVELAYRDTVDCLLDVIPPKWFRPLHRDLLVLEDATQVDVDDLYGPIRRREIGRDEAVRMIRNTLFPPPSTDKTREYLTQPDPGGLSWEERLRKWEPSARQQILGELTQSISQAEDLRTLRKRLEPAVGGIRYKAQRIARTEGRRVAVRAQQATFDQLGDMLDGMQVLAVMDQWTRPEHALRHGRIYRRQEDGSFRDAASGDPLPELPDEPNCRCYASPVLKPPEEFLDDPAVRATFKNASADTIPDPSAYSRWFDQADDRRRRLAVGTRRYNAMAGRLASLGQKPQWEHFVDPDSGKLLSTTQIRSESAADRETRRRAVEELILQRELLFKETARHGFVRPMRFLPKPQQTIAAGHGLPDVSTPEKMERYLRSVEQEIAGTKDVEWAIAFDADGRELFRQKGAHNSVGFTADQLQGMADVVVTHNHHPTTIEPSGTFAQDLPLSGEDGAFLLNHGLRQIRSVTTRYRYIAEPEPGHTAEPGQGIRFQLAWHNRVVFHWRRERDRLLRRGLSPGEAERRADAQMARHQHRAWLDTAERWGLKYQRKRRNDV